MSERSHHRPMLPGAELFDEIEDDYDPTELSEAASRAATALVRRGHREAESGADPALVQRVLALAENEGMETIAALWSGAPADSLAGALWRLYLLRTWIVANPHSLADDFSTGRAQVPVADAVSGVSEPPGPQEMKALADAVLAGVVQGDFADTLFRASAFVKVIAAGRLGATYAGDVNAARLAVLADQLHEAGHLELAGKLT